MSSALAAESLFNIATCGLGEVVSLRAACVNCGIEQAERRMSGDFVEDGMEGGPNSDGNACRYRHFFPEKYVDPGIADGRRQL